MNAPSQYARSAPVWRPTGTRGQSLLETCLVMLLTCLIVMGLFQIAHMLAAREVLHHAAARGTRAQTVGLNWWMVEKCIRVACIPNAGRMTTPDYVVNDAALQSAVASMTPGELFSNVVAETGGLTPVSAQLQIETARIPEYLGAENWARAHYILDYRNWDGIRGDHGTPMLGGASVLPDDLLEVNAEQHYPMTNFWGRLTRVFYAADSVLLTGRSELENHYALYLDDKGW